MTNLVHKSKKSEQVVSFIKRSELKQEINNLVENNQIYGFYYDRDGEIVAEDIWGDVYKNITK